jgi:Bacterial SH3 domain
LVVDDSLNLRDNPGLSASVRRVMADNEVLLVRDGPVDADGYTWYRVWNYGGEGWAAGEFLRFDPNGFPPEEGG